MIFPNDFGLTIPHSALLQCLIDSGKYFTKMKKIFRKIATQHRLLFKLRPVGIFAVYH
jgi:hypothetical protein